MEFATAKNEAVLRLSALVLLVLAALLVRFNTQTKVIFASVSRTATYSDLDALKVSMYIDGAAAAYYILQLSRCSLAATGFIQANTKTSYILVAWFCFLMDQAAVYFEFGGNSARLQASMLAVTGAKDLQWIKLCDRFTRFCFQVGGAIACSYAACFFMAMVSAISAYNLFTLYSPNSFMRLKLHLK